MYTEVIDGGYTVIAKSTPGGTVPIDNTEDPPVVYIEDAGDNDYFVWENWSPYIFPGFYESYLSSTSWIEHEIESNQYEFEEGYDGDEEMRDSFIIDIDEFDKKVIEKHPYFYRAYAIIVAEKYADCIWDKIVEEEMDRIVTSLNLFCLWSPDYYNFETDRLNLRLRVNWDELEDYIYFNLDKFRKYLKDAWTSRSGFISFVPNTYEKLLENKRKYRIICLEFMFLNLLSSDPDYYEAWNTVDNRMYDWLYELDLYRIIREADKLEDIYGE